MSKLTTTALRGRWQGKDRWISDGGGRGSGRLLARISRDGVLLYFQYHHDGRKRLLPLGEYDEAGRRGLTLLVARDKAAQLAALYRDGVDVHKHLERRREAEENAQRLAEENARREQEAARRGTLRALLIAYVEHLERQGKASAPGARGALTRHVLDGAPHIADLKATEVPADEFVLLLGKLTESGKGRTAAIVRAYLRAAYSLAIRSRMDPGAPLTMRAFGITANPVADIDTLSRYNRPRNRVLSTPELVAYIERLETMPDGAQQDALELLLRLGGQRPAQLLRAKPVDVDLSAGTITLYDSKGARRQPRQHVVPLTEHCNRILRRRLAALKEGEPLFSTDGRTHMRAETVSAAVAELSRQMVKAREAREPFQLRDVRRTCETMLASLGVSSDIRAQLQSHGLGGIQQRHYDRHSYMVEKRQALELWARHLRRLKAREQAEVVPIRGRRARDDEHAVV